MLSPPGNILADFANQVASLGHLAARVVLRFGSESSLFDGSPADSSMLAVQVSMIPREFNSILSVPRIGIPWNNGVTKMRA